MLIGYRANNHPQQVASRGALLDVDDRGTNDALFRFIEQRHGPFSIDVAASERNARCERFYDRETDGLAQTWAGESVWCNPPYSGTRPWLEKAWRECDSTDVVAMLLPANRTEQPWWQELVEPFRDRPGSPLAVQFLRGRPRFIAPGDDRIRPNQRPPFGCVLLVWRSLRPAFNPVCSQSEMRLDSPTPTTEAA